MQLFLPLDKITECHVCGAAKELRLCSQCAERAYCSTNCQKQDWKTHKPSCKTDRIDLTSYHPILACIAEVAHTLPGEPHPALLHRVTNTPNPDTPASLLPDGSMARIVRLGKVIDESEWVPDISNWWPTAMSPAVRRKLTRRIMREGNVLPTVMSTCLAIMLALYTTTTAEDKTPHRIRLRYRSSPISDFGIVTGSARVIPDDQLAYILPDKSILKGQDPADHYWIYFRTQKGEEVLLDCAMFTFNMCIVASTEEYVGDDPKLPTHVPVWFKDREISKGLARSDPLLTERCRFSMLRDEGLREVFENVEIGSNGDLAIPEKEMKVVVDFMSKIAGGRPVTAAEQNCLFSSWVQGTHLILDTAVKSQAWKRFPSKPQVGFETDPNEKIWEE